DWSQLHPQQQRVGLVHAAANGLALAFYTSSLLARVRGRSLTGKAMGFAGLGAMTLGGYLGGHLVFRQAAGANHTADTIDLFPRGWEPLRRRDDPPGGRATQRTIEC